jgi:hypothetical protein
MRLGGLTLLGSALLAAGAVGLQWSFAPALLRNPWVEVGLAGTGIILLSAALCLLALDPRAGMAPSRPPTNSALPFSGSSSLMPFSADLQHKGSVPTVARFPSTSATASPPSSSAAGMLAGTSAGNTRASTLVISFADGPILGIHPAARKEPPTTVTGLVDRMETVQRTSTMLQPTSARLVLPPPTPSRTSELLHHLTQIPTPPPEPRATALARRCTDCGEPLGSPPQFEPCEECRQALCERCYWRVSSGPRSHFCSTCYRERSVPPLPKHPAIVAGPTQNFSTSVPSAQRPPTPRRGS